MGVDASGDREELMDKVHEVIKSYIVEAHDETSAVIRLQSPEEIFDKIDLNIKEEPRSYDEVVEACKVVLDNSVR